MWLGVLSRKTEKNGTPLNVAYYEGMFSRNYLEKVSFLDIFDYICSKMKLHGVLQRKPCMHIGINLTCTNILCFRGVHYEMFAFCIRP